MAAPEFLLMAGTEDHDLTKLDGYRAVGGYAALEQARALEPPGDHRRDHHRQPARSGRRRVPDRP